MSQQLPGLLGLYFINNRCVHMCTCMHSCIQECKDLGIAKKCIKKGSGGIKERKWALN